MSILLIEDDARIAAFIVKGLRASGYAVEHATTGSAGLAQALTGGYELLILDLRLPDLHGFQVVRDVRAASLKLPILILSASGDVSDRVAGLNYGADDYLVKPFAFDELLARVRVRLRPGGAVEPTTFAVAGITLDVRRRLVSADGREVELTAREFALLEMFMRYPGQVLSRDQILTHVWGHHFDPGTNLVDVFVRRLRKHIGHDAVETVRRVGYRLVEGGGRSRTNG